MRHAPAFFHISAGFGHGGAERGHGSEPAILSALPGFAHLRPQYGGQHKTHGYALVGAQAVVGAVEGKLHDAAPLVFR